LNDPQQAAVAELPEKVIDITSTDDVGGKRRAREWVLLSTFS
jgi:hypothetical protein